ncbi:hypothetical protein D3C76_1186800 [compost metagenome]
MSQIGPGLVDIRQRIALGHGAVAQAIELREHIPHPVAALASGLQLLHHLVIHPVLRLDEALQIKIGAHVHPSSHRFQPLLYACTAHLSRQAMIAAHFIY